MIYFIQGVAGGPIKIGYTNNVTRRLAQLRSGNPTPLRVIATTEGTLAIEAQLHRKFARYQVRREWFEDVEELRMFIAQLAHFDAQSLLAVQDDFGSNPQAYVAELRHRLILKKPGFLRERFLTRRSPPRWPDEVYRSDLRVWIACQRDYPQHSADELLDVLTDTVWDQLASTNGVEGIPRSKCEVS